MSLPSPHSVFLAVSSPSWNAQRWIKSIPRKDWGKVLPVFWKLSKKMEKKRFASKKLKIQTLFQVEMGSLQVAEALGQLASWKEKRAWCASWFKSASFLKEMENALFSDECIDRVLGLFERKVQHRLKNMELPKIYQEEALYLDLSPEDLYTPYRVICRWGKSLKLKPGTRVVDMGSGVGRIPLTLGVLYPKVDFTGIEIMKERHEMAELARGGLKLRNVTFLCKNAARAGLPQADYYYFFNPFVGDTLRQVFRQLHRLSQHGSFRVAVAQIELPWRYVQRLPWLKLLNNFRGDKHWEGIGIGLFELRKLK